MKICWNLFPAKETLLLLSQTGSILIDLESSMKNAGMSSVIL